MLKEQPALHLIQVKSAAALQRNSRTPDKRRLLLTPFVGRVVVEQNLEPGPFEVVELARSQREPEHRADQEDEDDRERDEEIEDIHRAYPSRRLVPLRRRSRSALSTTASELPDIPTPAIQGVTRPAAAAGTAARL